MIKFFRKIRYDLMEKNKTGKYLKYAIGEIVLVVIGILIALQINNWNNGRSDRNLEIKYLRSLKADFETDLINLDNFMVNRKLKFTDANNVLEMDDPITYKEINDMDSIIWNVFIWKNISPRTNTRDELIGSGNLNLITNDSIKSLMLDVYQDFGTMAYSIDHLRREYENYLYDRSAKLRELDPFRDLNEYIKNHTLSITSEKSETQLIELREQCKALLHDLTFRNGLKNAIFGNKSLYRTCDLLSNDIKHLIDLIELEIDKND